MPRSGAQKEVLAMEPQDELEKSSDHERHKQNSSAFFILLGSVGAILLLGILLNLQLSSFTRILLLLSLFMLALLAIAMLERHHATYEMVQDQAVDDDVMSTETDEEERRAETTQEGALTDFEQLVQDALNTIPEEFHERMTNLVVIVEDEPDSATLASSGVSEGHILLGLYHGTPLTSWGYPHALMPERITIYQHTIERYCGGDPERIREQVRSTLLHEVAHHFGIAHEDMPIWVR